MATEHVMQTSDTRAPRWDMTVIYPGLETSEFQHGFAAVVQAIDQFVQLFDQHESARRDRKGLDKATVQGFDLLVDRYNAVLEQAYTLQAYILSFISTDSRDDRAQAAWSEFESQLVRLSMLRTRFTAWVGSLNVDALMERSTRAREHAFLLRKAQTRAAHLMSPAEENLAAEMEVTGSAAWDKLYYNVTSQLLVTLEHQGERQALPMSVVRSLAHDPDRSVRRRAYEAELAAWRQGAVPIAAALNSIKGETNVLTARRGWNSPLEAVLFENNIDRTTLDAMLEAMRDAFPDFRRYLRAKARALGTPVLAWYDLFAPVGGHGQAWSFDGAGEFIQEQFGAFSPKLRELAERAFRERWIDAEPRPGKGDGAFCMPLRDGESRILTNFQPVFGAVTTLAHELGHAYHNLNLARCTMLQRTTPMTLAETASIFCETIVRHAAARKADAQEQLALLEASLQGACQVVVDISSRFLFEERVFDRRRQRELSVEELNQLMLEAQLETYGDGLDPDALHPYMWAVKSHYYASPFYNFPYSFGLLFGLGLYAQYQEEPETFKARYDDLLASTGSGDAAELTARFGIDIRTPEFWRSSLDVIRADIERFEALVDQTGPGAPGGNAS